MINAKSIIAIIPARGGSKGLPRKNIKNFNGKPLIAWTIKQALASKYIDDVIVSTDDSEIADISKKFGASVPFLRPNKLAKDNSKTSDVIIHVIESMLGFGKKYEYIILLEPTSPLRKIDDIDNAIELMYKNKDCQSVISVGEVHTEHPMIVKKISRTGHVKPYMQNKKQIHQRQQADKAFFPYGVVYISKTDSFKNYLSFYLNNSIPYFIERWQNYEIDDITDFQIIEYIFKLKLEKIYG